MRTMMLVALVGLVGCGVTTPRADAVGGECSCPAGPQGAQGPKGDRGEPGEPGAAGAADGSSSGSRLRYLGKTLRGTDGSTLVQQGGFFDEELGVGCTPLPAPDGRTRCLPAGAWFSPAFVDADCTQPAAIVMLSGDCAVPAFVGSATTGTCGGSATYAFHRTAGEVAEAFTMSGEECRPFALPAYRYFRIGTEEPHSSFVAFE